MDDAGLGPWVRGNRIPPPPPPGFGDDDYYQLYGRPEDYHRYRQHMEEQHMYWQRHEVAGVIRHGSDRRRVPIAERLQWTAPDALHHPLYRRQQVLPEGHRRPHPKTRLGFHEPRRRARNGDGRGHGNVPMQEDVLEWRTGTRNEGPEGDCYDNVALRYESEGTPSLSGMDDTEDSDEEDSPCVPLTRRNQVRVESGCEDFSTESESQMSEFSDDEDEEDDNDHLKEHSSEETKSENDDVYEERQPSSSVLRSVVVEKSKRVPIKQRLGIRVTCPKPKPPSRVVQTGNCCDSKVSTSLSTSKNRHDTKSRGMEQSSRSSKRRHSPSRRGRTSKTPSRNLKRSRNRRRRSSKGIVISQREMQNENEKMLQRLASKQKDLLKLSSMEKNKSLAKLAGIELPLDALKGPPSPHGLKRQRKQRSPTSGSSSESSVERRHDKKMQNRGPPEKSSHSNGNAKGKRRQSPDCIEKSRRKSRSKSPQLKKSDNQSKRSSSSTQRTSLKSSRSRKKNDSLRPCRSDEYRRYRRSRDRIRVSGMESTTSSSRRERILLSRSRSRERHAKNSEKNGAKSPDRWQHDKFQSGLIPLQEDSDLAFGTHWTKNKTERSKERRRRSRSSSSSKCGDRRRRRSSSSRSHRKRSRSYSSRSSSRLSSLSPSSASSGSVRRERRKHMAEKKKKMELAAAAGIPYVEEPLHPPPTIQPIPDTVGVSLALTGNLLRDTNIVNGVVVKYSEPQEARKPKTKWRLYVFKGIEELPILYIHRQSAYLLGRDRKVADIPIDHPSCSKQHAVLQYRLVDYTRVDGTIGKRVTPYVVDLDSANGTTINNKKIEPRKFVQLFERDILKFGFSSREYVLLHDQSKDDEDLGVD